MKQTLYFQYISSFLFFLPFVAFTEKMALETQAKFVHLIIIFHLISFSFSQSNRLMIKFIKYYFIKYYFILRFKCYYRWEFDKIIIKTFNY